MTWMSEQLRYAGDCACADYEGSYDVMWKAAEMYRPIDALCARHDIDIDGIVRLVDEVFDASVFRNVTHGHMFDGLRRLARGES